MRTDVALPLKQCLVIGIHNEGEALLKNSIAAPHLSTINFGIALTDTDCSSIYSPNNACIACV